MEQTISDGIGDFRRLKLFTYEPSYYALLFIPIFFFYFLQYFFRQNTIYSTLVAGNVVSSLCSFFFYQGL